MSYPGSINGNGHKSFNNGVKRVYKKKGVERTDDEKGMGSRLRAIAQGGVTSRRRAVLYRTG